MKNKIFTFITILAVLLAFSACGADETQKQPESLELEVTPQTLAELSENTALRELRIVNSDCYDEIEAYISSNPQVRVLYDIKIGDMTVTNEAEQLTFEKLDPAISDELCESNGYLKNIKSITVSEPVTLEQIQALRNAYPGAELTYCAEFDGKLLGSDTTSIDLSETADKDGCVQSVSALPELFCELTDVTTVKPDGSDEWTLDQLAALRSALPEEISIKCNFELFGQILSSEDEEIIYEKAGLHNEDLDTVRKALSLLEGCRRFVLDNSGPSYEELAKLREEFPDKGIVWRVHFHADSLLTDEKILWSTFVRDENCHVLNYCTELEYIDLGHDEWLSDISFTQYMPNLKVLIIGITDVSDLTPLSNCKELEYLEVFRTRVKDLSPLSACTKLEHLNISLLEVRDLSPLYSLTSLKRLWCINDYYLNEAQKEDIQKALPECEFCFREGSSLTDFGWRKLDDGTLAERYALLKEQMGYGDYNSPRDKVDYDKTYQRGYA